MLDSRIERITIRNFRSLRDITVELGDLTILAGMNGGGKSNFIDALRFVRDALRVGLGEALNNRIGIERIKYSSSRYKNAPAIELEFELRINGVPSRYMFAVDSKGDEPGHYFVEREECTFGGETYIAEKGQVKNVSFIQQSDVESLTLPILTIVIKTLKPLLDFLAGVQIYQMLPTLIHRLPQEHTLAAHPVYENGRNLGSALIALHEKLGRAQFDEVFAGLCLVTPGLSPVDTVQPRSLGNFIQVDLKFEHGDFDLSQVSDGTIRTLTLLTALHQQPTLPLMVIEEPEIMLHPPAMAVLADEIKQAARSSQIIVTTHSPDLISRFPPESLRVVEMVDGATRIDSLDAGQIQTVNDRIFNSGDLLRIEGLKRG